MDEPSQELEESHPEWASYSHVDGFANAHYSLIMLGNTEREVKEPTYTRTVAPAGTNSYDYANFVIDVAESELASTYNEKGSDVKFNTDVSLTYHQKASDYMAISVRGVLKAVAKSTIRSDAARTFGVSELKAGEEYSVDYEVTYTIKDSMLVCSDEHILQ